MRAGLPKTTPLFLLLVLFVTFFPVGLVTPQVPPQDQREPESFSKSPAYVLLAEAKTADSEEGNQQYSKHLTEMFVTNRTGDAYVAAFSRRLAAADLMARRGKREWIPESVVAKALNDLMKQVTDPSSKLLQTDANVVHQLRLTMSEISPALSTVNTNSSECLPAEAVLLMNQLLAHSGSVKDPCPPTPDATGRRVQHPCAGDVFADLRVSGYSRSYSRSENVVLFDHVAKLFGM